VRPGLINVDFADVRTVMSEMGLAMMGTGHARGDDRAQAAAEAAIQNPLLDDINLSGANGILDNITAGPDFTMAEFDEVGRTIEGFASEDATVVIGTVLDPDMQDDVRVTVVATGLNRVVARQPMPREDFGHARGNDREQRRPQVQLIHNQGKRDGTTGMLIDDVADPYTPGNNIASALRGRSGGGTTVDSAKPEVADFGGDSSYLDIPAFLRRQAD
jgi:cell division protein FtsZ